MPKRNFSVKIDIKPNLVLPANEQRLQYSIQNRGTGDIAAGSNDNVSTDQAEIISPGQLLSDDVDTEDVYLIASSGAQDVRVTEVLKRPGAS